MADHVEYEIRKKRMETDPSFKNYKEGWYRCPVTGKTIKTVVSYEAEMINIQEFGADWSSSMYPALWDVLMSGWVYIGRTLTDMIG